MSDAENTSFSSSQEAPLRYIGTKAVLAQPMTRGDYNAYQGWTLPADQDGADEGYLVEYTDGGKPNHPKHAGYISWSPKDVFERAYQPAGMTDTEFLLSILGASPVTYLREDGSLRRDELLASVRAYSALYAARVRAA